MTDSDAKSNRRAIRVTERNLWFLERSLPLFGMIDFFPTDCVAKPSAVDPVKKLTIETDQGWSFSSDIAWDSKIFRNSSRNRGTGRWVTNAELKPGDQIIIEKISEYTYRLMKQTPND